jgi:Cdc6-like AAA superfamily ATPase
MSYDLKIAKLTSEVLGNDDIRYAINNEDGLNEDFLRLRLAERVEAIRSEAASAVANYDMVEEDIEADKAEVEALGTQKPGHIRAIEIAFNLAWMLLIVIALLNSFASWPALAWQSFLDIWEKLTVAAQDQLIGMAVGSPVAAMVYYFYWRLRVRPRTRRDLTRDFQLDTAGARLDAARVAADTAVLAAAQKVALELINETTKRFYQEQLFAFAERGAVAPAGFFKTTGLGLAEGLNAATEVATDVQKEVARIFKSMPSASIGVAGPRGIGKSTLLWSLCNSTIDGVDRQKTIAVYTAAPVEYEGRDFLLHIFSGLCRKVLRARNQPEIMTPTFSDQEMDEIEGSSVLLRGQRKLGGLLLMFGAAAITIGFALALGLAFMAMDMKQREAAATAAHVTSAAVVYAKEMNRITEFKVGPLLQWGFFSALLGAGLIYLDFSSRRARMRAMSSRQMAHEQGGGEKSDRLASEAQRHLADINFQRNYSSGWSGGLKFPAGFDLSSTIGLQLSQKQKSLPDLADNFRQFIELITADKDSFQTVIIAIDELDKMKSAEAAQQFLNEIKMIFAIPHCFFFISVSENALSTFERRGLSVRDAFDSAFDDIRYIDYLTLDGSRRMLFRRVLNLPIQYFGLCHVLSAGLPRDLIRVTRTMLELAEKSPNQNRLEEIAGKLIKTEIEHKIRAASIAARDIALEPEVPDFLQNLAKLDELNIEAADAAYRYTLKLPVKRAAMSDDEKAARQKLMTLYRELNAFFYYATTARELFCKSRSNAEWDQAEADDGWIAGLAKARQALEMGADIAKFRMDELRRKFKLQSDDSVAPTGKPASKRLSRR